MLSSNDASLVVLSHSQTTKMVNMERGEVESANPRASRIFHRFFELGLLIKGIDGGFELLGGLLLLLLSPYRINRFVMPLVQGELEEDPEDLFANLLLHTTQNVIHAKLSASLFLLIHGVVKLLLVGGLLTNKLWSYPVAIVVFSAFTAYQLYQLGHQYSLFLVTVTVLDVFVIVLIVAEYQHMRTARTRHLR